MTNKSYFIESFVDSGLGNSAYLIGSHDTHQGILIDPLRDVDRYLQVASNLGLSLTHVLDTHLHADFISGNREIAYQTKAAIGASAEAYVGFDHTPLTDNSVIDMGAFQIRVMTTPGHTPEHISFLLVEADRKTPTALFSGGALIVGGAARTDLLSPELTRPLAQHLYHTIHDKLLNLPDEVAVFPTHGAGSFCVAPASPERTTTIGRERKTNALAQPQSEDEFVQLALTGLPLYPTYYKYMRELNQRGAKVLGGLPHLQPYSAAEVKALMDEGVAVLDIRHQKQFAAGHIPNSFGIRVDAPVVVWAGWVIPFGSRIVLLGGSPEQREDALRQLIRIGYDDVLGYVEGGIDAWAKQYPVETIESIQPRELRERLDDVTLVDVRRLSEWQEEHIPGAIHFEGGRIPWEEWPFRLDKPLVIQCASGNRSMVAISVLKRRGIHNLIQADGGITKWKMHGLETVRENHG
ncbi:MAG: MBL fold metallo-hydrolase [Byssovorax cruenta]